MPAPIALRPYQQECVDTINALEGGAHLVQMATGLGKTVTFSSIERRGRVLIRPSGTEPLLRIMVEADDAYLAAELTSRMAESLSVEHQA